MRHHITYFMFFMLQALNITPSSEPTQSSKRVQSVDTFFVVKTDPKKSEIIDSYKSLIQEQGQSGTIDLLRTVDSLIGMLYLSNDKPVVLDEFSVSNFFTEWQNKSNATIVNGQRYCIFRSASRHIVQLSYPNSPINNHYKQQCIYVPPTTNASPQVPAPLATHLQQSELVESPSSLHEIITRGIITDNHKQVLHGQNTATLKQDTTIVEQQQQNYQPDNETNTPAIQQPLVVPAIANQQNNNVASSQQMENHPMYHYVPYAAIGFILLMTAIRTHR